MRRRSFLLGSAGALAVSCARPEAAAPSPPAPSPPAFSLPAQAAALSALERDIGGRLGVFALDTHTGRELAHRPDERFALCSTFKWVLGAQVLARADRGQLALDEVMSYGPADLLEYAPVAKAHVAQGSLAIDALARAAVVVSDNTAANLLLARLGGPPAFTEFVRSHDDRTTRLDRAEPLLNSNEPGDPRDTTSPRAMVHLMSQLLLGGSLSPSARERLLGWLYACDTGKSRLRAGLPRGWPAGDKTGTGNNGACNDVAIAYPPGRAPLLLAVYLSESRAALSKLEGAHAEVARIVARGQ
jgi:beta-lactamase class A